MTYTDLILKIIGTSSHMSSTLSSTAPDPNSGDAKSKEIQDLKGAISNLTQRLENLSKGTNSNKTLSPVFMSKEQKRELAPMSKNYKKTLHDEVVHILNNINLLLQFDVSKTYSNQKKAMNKKLLPAVKSAMNPSIQAYDKMSRRRRGLQHMISIRDNLLYECHPENLTWESYMKDCEKALNTSDLHSDEWSSDDEELAKEERDKKIRSKRLASTNSIIKVYDKKWRSSRIKQILSRAKEIRISIRTGLSRKRYRSDDIVDNKSKPNEDMPGWWISSRWVAQESDEDDDDEDDNDELNDGDNNVGGGDNDGNVGGDNNDDNDVGGGNKDNDNDVGGDNDNDVGGGNKDNDNDVGGGNKDNDNDAGGGNKDNDIDIDIEKDDNGNNNDVVNARKNSLDGPFYLFVPDSIKKGSTTSTSSNTSKHSSKTRKRSIFSCH
ncbi:hypothetical protein RclHR1_18470003 [Rhizophagus clarus]|uniref:Uncharacterized protein n=1 Tax=Rhizophagus clarus TaxID=94130 RepID=A0A2Z6QMK1_9GLOM|nr:hypothetical protein RclHR1_18470003 [Rhizophagus clarus]